MVAPVIRVGVASAVAALALLALVVGPAHAHAELESSDPADGAVLEVPPAQISFTFGERLIEQGNAVTVTEVAAGERLAVGPVVVDGDSVSVTWPQDSSAGQFRAAFRVVSVDGHPIKGSITFTVATDAGGEGGASPSASAAAVPSAQSPSAQPSSSGSAVTSPSAESPGPATAVAVDLATSDESGSGWVATLVVLLLAGALVMSATLFLGRRRRGR